MKTICIENSTNIVILSDKNEERTYTLSVEMDRVSSDKVVTLCSPEGELQFPNDEFLVLIESLHRIFGRATHDQKASGVVPIAMLPS